MNAPPNDNGVYEPEIVTEIARRGRSYASVEIAQCLDRLYRFALDVSCTERGFCGPIMDHSTGYATASLAKDEAIAALLGRFPKPAPHDSDSVRAELNEMRQQIEGRLAQPTLF